MRRTVIRPFIVVLALALSAGLGGCAREPTIAFRLASTSPTEGRNPMTLLAQDSTFYVSDSSVLSDNELAEVRVIRAEPRMGLRIKLTAEGQSRLAAATASHVGERLAR